MSDLTPTTLRCPDHDVELQHRPFGDTVNAMICPSEPDSFMSTRNRWCTRCGARDASWMSGMCSDCYSITSREQKQSQKEWHDNSVTRQAISAAIELARTTASEEVVSWLTAYKEELP